MDLATHARPFVTVKALAAYLECDRRTIARLIEAGALPAHRVGRLWRIPTDGAREMFRVKRHPVAS